MTKRTLLATAVAVAAALPATASATTYCVYNQACVDAGGTVTVGLQQALDQALNHPGPDRVEIGATPMPLTGPFQYHTMTERVDIVGAGIDTTVLKSPGAGQYALSLQGDGLVKVSDLSVQIPAGSNGRGLRLYSDTVAERVDVSETGNATSSIAVGLFGGTLRYSKVSATGTSSVGVLMSGNGGWLADTQVLGTNGVVVNGAHDQERDIHRSQIFGTVNALWVHKGLLRIANTVVGTREGQPGAHGIRIADGNPVPGDLRVEARHVTIAGGGAGQTGVSITNSLAGETSVLDLRDSVITGYGHPITRTATAGSAGFLTLYSAYPAVLAGDSTGPGWSSEGSFVRAEPQFVDPETSDYTPKPGSPLIDAGTPGLPVEGSDPPVDVRWLPRIVDGQGGCSARRDIGAFEYQPAQPIRIAATADRTSAAIGETVTFSAEGTCHANPLAAGGMTYRWTFDDGTTAEGKSVQHAWTAGGPRTATLTVADDSDVTATAQVAVELPLPPSPAAEAPAAAPAPAATTAAAPAAAVLSALKLKRRGTVRFVLSAAAPVTLTLQRKAAGTWKRTRTKRIAGKAGVNRLRFALTRPGVYRVEATVAGASRKARAKVRKVR